MRKRKELLAAGIVRDIRFASKSELDIYLYDLKRKYMQYKILEQVTEENGAVLARIVQSYNNTPLIQLYEED